MTEQLSSFDPASFLDATTSEANTRRPPLPQGRDFIGMIGEPSTARQTKGTKENNKDQVYTWLDLPISVDLNQAPDVRESVGQDTVVLQFSARLDISPSGGLDNSVGKNNGLRVIREALGMNVAGQPFSIRMMQGRPIRVKISHRTYQGDVFDQIDSVAKP